MSQWKFILIDRNGLRTEVPEPLNWADPEITVSRENENNWHGIFFDYGVEKLQFDGLGASLLKAEYETYRVNGDMHLDILFKCSEDNLYDVFCEGFRIAFDEYSSICGDECMVSVGVQDSNDIMLFKNNFDQPVDLENDKAFDQTTVLSEYDKLGFNLTIPSRGLPQKSRSINAEKQTAQMLDFLSWSNIAGSGITGTEIGKTQPIFSVSEVSEVLINNINSGPYYVEGTGLNITPFIELQYSSALKCLASVYNVKYRVKGRLIDNSNASRVVGVNLNLVYGTESAPIVDVTQEQAAYEVGTFVTTEFDLIHETNISLSPGDSVFLYSAITYEKLSSAAIQGLIFEYDTECYFEISGVSYCEETDSRSYMINETASRIAEAITNNKMRFYSETFGRTDSQPYAVNFNPCPGLFSITSGLNIRRKKLINNAQPRLFLSMKQLFDGLNPLWNIGIGIEPDPNRTGYNRVRFEHWRYFYQNEVVVRFNDATRITTEVDPSRLFNQLMIGYNKWEAEGTTGLYELMTKRQYRINVNSGSNPMDKYTDFICSPYTVEITRRKDQTTEDWQYDNDIFGFCLKKSGDDYAVETFLDNVINPTNVIDANTCYNGKITPARMAMRWFDYIMQGLGTIFPDSKLIFSKGEGNYIASFQTTSCNIEGKILAENEDIDLTDFEDLNDAKPITYAETVTFDHPMNYSTFKRIKDDPTIRYKSFAYVCNGVGYEGWLDIIRYRPMTGMATITLIPKSRSVIVAPPEPECLAEVSNLDFEANGDGYMLITWDASVPGATFWQLIVTMDGQPFQTLNVTETSFQYANLLPGNYGVTIIPFCDVDFPGANYVQGSFDIAAPTFALTLSAILTTGREPHNKLQLTGVGSFAATSGFSFGFGQCCDNTSIPGPATCSSYPGSTFPTPQGLFSFNVGDTTKMVESGVDTPGASFGVITKVVLFNLVGITPAQITKAEGQTWDLEFL